MGHDATGPVKRGYRQKVECCKPHVHVDHYEYKLLCGIGLEKHGEKLHELRADKGRSMFPAAPARLTSAISLLGCLKYPG